MPGKRIILIFIILISYTLNAQKQGDNVLCVFVDEFGCQWFGTDNGLLRKCGEIWKAYPVQSDFPGTVNNITRVSTPSGPVLWIGTRKGIVKISYSAGSIISASQYTSKTNTFLSDTINGIASDKYASIFFATPMGIGILAGETWKFISKITDITENKLTSAQSRGDTIFFGTTGEGVARLVRSVDGYSGASSFVAPWSALSGDNITCVFIDSKGHQWFGSDKGLSCHSRFDAKEGWDDSFTEKLPDKDVTSITEDKSGNIWVGTHGGLVRFKAGSYELSLWKVSNGLASDIINNICVDTDNSIWIGTNKGVSHFDGSRFSNINTSDLTKSFPPFKRFLKLTR